MLIELGGLNDKDYVTVCFEEVSMNVHCTICHSVVSLTGYTFDEGYRITLYYSCEKCGGQKKTHQCEKWWWETIKRAIDSLK